MLLDLVLRGLSTMLSVLFNVFSQCYQFSQAVNITILIALIISQTKIIPYSDIFCGKILKEWIYRMRSLIFAPSSLHINHHGFCRLMIWSNSQEHFAYALNLLFVVLFPHFYDQLPMYHERECSYPARFNSAQRVWAKVIQFFSIYNTVF